MKRACIVFDLVDPGTYSVTIEATGFIKFIQENIQVQTRDDLTVNATSAPRRCSGKHHGNATFRCRYSSIPPAAI